MLQSLHMGHPFSPGARAHVMLKSERPIYTPKLVHRANEFKMATVLRRYMPRIYNSMTRARQFIEIERRGLMVSMLFTVSHALSKATTAIMYVTKDEEHDTLSSLGKAIKHPALQSTVLSRQEGNTATESTIGRTRGRMRLIGPSLPAEFTARRRMLPLSFTLDLGRVRVNSRTQYRT